VVSLYLNAADCDIPIRVNLSYDAGNMLRGCNMKIGSVYIRIIVTSPRITSALVRWVNR
jgi:hypothetical protein